MNRIDHALLAPLVRGLCLNIAGRPLAVVPGDAATGTIPAAAFAAAAFAAAAFAAAAFAADLSPALKDGVLDEAYAAKLLAEACAAWRFDASAAGQAAGSYPSCLALTLDDQTALFWVDADLDAARRRAAAGDAGLLRTAPGSNAPAAIAGRADVVRDRIALVTGGAQGFGEEIVSGLVASGATVYVADLNLAGAEKLAARLNAEAGRTAALPAAVNVADEASVEALFRLIAATSGGLDLCVSNAGVLKAGSVLDQDLGAFKFVTDVNYTGFFIIAQHAARLLRRQHLTAPAWKTDLVQINSKSGLEGSNKNGAYAGGKFGAIGLVQSFALELVEYGIKVNAVCPGNFLDGPLWSDPEKGLFVQYLNAGKVPGAKTVADVRAFYEAKVPLKRGCTGQDVMRALFYIVEQEYETGQAVPVTGGQVMLH
jgi:sorbitol-6-phosphate 2-dehydrogenase